MPTVIAERNETVLLDWGDQIRYVLRRARTFRDKSQRDIGTSIGRSERQIRRIENGESIAEPDVVERWLRACGVEIIIELRSKW